MNDDVDFVLTFEELGALFLAKEIEIGEMRAENFDGLGSGSAGRGFALSQGVSRAVEGNLEEGSDLKGLVINGLDKKGLNQLKIAGKGKFSPGLIEVMSCKGGCLHGPGVAANPASARKVLEVHCAETLGAIV